MRISPYDSCGRYPRSRPVTLYSLHRRGNLILSDCFAVNTVLHDRCLPSGWYADILDSRIFGKRIVGFSEENIVVLRKG